MRLSKSILLALIICLIPPLVSGCWNYREVEKLAIVAGVAIDQGNNNNIKMTVEIVEISSGKDGKTTSKLITMEGQTIFDAARNEISLSGKRLYWSHAKIVILSKEIASKGIIQVLDWFNRDAETRGDIHVLVSKGKTAREILKGEGTTTEVVSYELEEMLKNQKSLSKAPVREIWKVVNELEAKGLTPTVPTIELKNIEGKKIPNIMGTAIFKKDKLIGFLNGEETKDMLFVQDEIKGGVLIAKGQEKTQVSLEIFKNKTTIKPVVKGNSLAMQVKTETIVAIDELGGSADLVEDFGRQKLEHEVSDNLKKRLEGSIRKVQTNYGIDIFGFGSKLREEQPKTWQKVGAHWNDEFKTLKVSVQTKVHIRNSAMLAKPLKVGE